MIRFAIAALLVALFACEVDARPRRRARRSNTYYTTSYNTATHWGGNPQRRPHQRPNKRPVWAPRDISVAVSAVATPRIDKLSNM